MTRFFLAWLYRRERYMPGRFQPRSLAQYRRTP